VRLRHDLHGQRHVQDLTPRALNDWLNQDAVRDSRGWVSRGYAYGNVLWISANQLSAEMAEEFGTPTIRFNGWGPGDDDFIRSELEAGRPVVLEIPGHFIAAYGIDEATGDILIYDPYYPDRTTIEYYHSRGVPIRGSRLFEPSEDLSGVMITSPRDVRIKVTRKDTGEEVGTLNTAPADEAAERARVEVEGAGYLTAPAWRDPTCTEKAPPPEAGVNQIWLPGSIDDYTIEYLNTTDQVPTVAVHSYSRDGEVEILLLEGAPTGQIQSFDPDPDGSGTETPEPSGTPDSTPSGTPQTTPTSPGGGGPITGPTNTPVPGATTTIPVSPTPTTPGAPTATPTATPLPAAPVITGVTCTVGYQEAPKQANVQCIATVTGTTTSQTWDVNGIPTGVNGLVYNTTFTSNTNITVQFNACNGPTCVNQVRAVQIVFPTGGTPTVTATPTNTPPGGVATFPDLDVVCGANPVPNIQTNINCTASFAEPFTSITWTAPGTNNPNQVTGVKTYNTSVAHSSPLFVMAPGGVSAAQSSGIISHTFTITANVCLNASCRSVVEQLTIMPKYRPGLDWGGLFCNIDGDNQINVFDNGFGVSVPNEVFFQLEAAFLQFYINGVPATLAPPVTVDGLWWELIMGPFPGTRTLGAQLADQGNLLGVVLPNIMVVDSCVGY
jgi:hypothetical protein